MPEDIRHVIRDGDFPIVYIAGKHLYKYFPDTGQVFLMKRVVGDEHGEKVGYGSLTRLESVVAPGVELIIPTNSTAATAGVWHYTEAGGSVLKPVVAMQGRNSAWIAASPMNPDYWGVVTNPTSGGGFGQVHVTYDAGATWETHTLLGIEGERVEWSSTTAERWFAGSRSGVLLGTGPSIAPTSVIVTGANTGVNVTDGVNDEVVFTSVQTAQGGFMGWISADGVVTRFTAYYSPFGSQHLERGVGVDNMGVSGGMTSYNSQSGYRVSTNYKTENLPGHSPSIAGPGWQYGTSTVDAFYDSQVDVIRKVTPPQAHTFTVEDIPVPPTSTTPVRTSIGFIRADRQTRTHLAAHYTGGSGGRTGDILMYDGVAWSSFTVGDIGAQIADRLDVIIRA